jgi:hypothetical protein
MVIPRTPRVFDGLFGLTPLRLAVWLTVIAAIFPGLFTDPFKLLTFMDDHQFHSWEEADRISIVDFGQLPLWNPYFCGGMVAGAAPENGSFAPDFLLRLLFGVTHGRRLAVVLFLTLGMEGMYRLCRTTDSSAPASLAAALVFATFNRLVTTYLGMGWINFFGFLLAPWVLLGLIKGRQSVAWRLVGGGALGWIALAAGTYTAPYTGIAAAFVTVAIAWPALFPLRRAELKATALSAATVAGVGLLIAAVKLVPMMLVMRDAPRVFTPVEQNNMFSLLSAYWGVYALVILLAFVGLFFRDVWARIFFLGACFFFTLAMGQFSDWAPAAIMKKLPLVSGLRLPDRFMVMFHLFAVVCAARGITQIEDVLSRQATRLWAWIRKPERRGAFERTYVPALLTALAAALVIRVGRAPLEEILETVEIKPAARFILDPPRAVVQPFKQHRGNRRDAHVFPAMNRGSLYCFVGIAIPESPLLRADLEAEEYPADPTIAKVKRLSWSPHEIVLAVEAAAPARVFVNQNWSRHWRTDVGKVVAFDELLAVDVPQGSHRVTLRYRDYTSIACFTISLTTLLVLLLYLARKGIGRLRDELVRYRAWGVPFGLAAAEPPPKDGGAPPPRNEEAP